MSANPILAPLWQRLPSHRAGRIGAALGLACIGLGATVMMGWLLRVTILVQVHPSFVPMMFNTALGFVLAGLGVLAVALERRRSPALLGFAVAALGLLTLGEYATSRDFGIDNLFVRHTILVHSSNLGRMAPNTALCFVLAGLALATRARLRSRRNPPAVAGVHGAIVTALGLVAALGYALGVESAYGWAAYTRMALHTALGFVALGIALIALDWRPRSADSGRRPWFFALLGVGLLTMNLTLWQSLEVREESAVRSAVSARLARLQSEFRRETGHRIDAVDRMHNRWEFSRGTERAAWEADAGRYLNSFPDIQAIEWVDASYHVRWIMPVAGNEAAQDLDLGAERRRREALIAARERDEITVSRTVNLVQGQPGFLVYSPLVVEQTFRGFLLAVIKVESLLAPFADRLTDEGFVLTVFDGEQRIWPPAAGGNALANDYAVAGGLDLRDIAWRARLTPTVDRVRGLRSALPHVVLAGGLLLIALILHVTVLAHRARTNLRHLRLETAARARAQNEAQAAHGRLKLILDSAREGICGLDRSGNIVFANPAACALTGYALDELCQPDSEAQMPNATPMPRRPCRVFWRGALCPRNECPVCHTFLAGVPGGNENAEFWRKDGSSFPVAYSSAPVRGPGGDVLGAVVTFQDISERKRADAALRRHTLELERSNRELDQFAYVASHDLKAPLRAVDHLASWIAADLGDALPPASAEYLRLMRSRIERMGRLLDDLLAYSRAGRRDSEPSSVDVETLVGEVFDLLGQADRFALRLHRPLPKIHARRVPLEQVFRNLFSNAIKHHDRLTGSIEVSARDVDGSIEFSVADDGPGIPPELREQAFGLFQTLKSRDEVEGSGMGLSIVRKIVEAEGGTVTLDANAPRGTVVCFRWPRTARSKDINDG